MTLALLSSTFFGPVQWYQKLHRYDAVVIERCDHFVKQTYRNRCMIAATQGVQALTVPVERQPGEKLEMATVQVSDHGDWRRLHWNALASAYGESPFFDYYADDLRPFFQEKPAGLWDYNMAIAEKMCELLDVRPRIVVSDHFHPVAAPGEQPEPYVIDGQAWHVDDFRDAIRPKHPAQDAAFRPKRYYQVYEQKHGFLPNLSILDLLFNQGPEGIFYL